jgi:hypothetical protein
MQSSRGTSNGSCEVLLAWLERSAGEVCAVLGLLGFLMLLLLLWSYEELVMLRVRKVRAGGVVCVELGVWVVLCVESWVGLGCGYWEVFLGSVGRRMESLMNTLVSSMGCLAYRRRCRHQHLSRSKTMTSQTTMSTIRTKRTPSRTKKIQ